MWKMLLVVVVIGLLSSVIIGQSGDTGGDGCPAIVATAFAAVEDFCKGIGRNQVCYGSFYIEATTQESAGEVGFNQVGDIVDVTDIASMVLSPMDVESGYWGMALMRLQANLPDTMPGQNVTFLLFGDVELTSAVDAEQVANGEYTPMQAFYLTTGIGDSQCEEAPESGMLVQTPEGVGEVHFFVNEVAVQMGSTVLFRVDGEGQMEVSTLEGAAVLWKSNGQTYPIAAGTQQRFSTLGEDPIAQMRLGGYSLVIPPEVYDVAEMGALPLGLLERQVEIQSPPDEDELAEFSDWVHDWAAYNAPDCNKKYPDIAAPLCNLLFDRE